MDDNSIRFLESRIRANQQSANALNRIVRVKRANANTKRQQLQKEVETLVEMKRDLEEYTKIVAEDIPDVPDFVSNYVKNKIHVLSHTQWMDCKRNRNQYIESFNIYWNKLETKMTGQLLDIINLYKPENRGPGMLNYLNDFRENLTSFLFSMKYFIRDLETQLIPAQEAKIQQIENEIAETNASANNYSLKTSTKRNTIKATQREKAEQEENLELRKNRLYNYFKSPKNLSVLTETMWEIPDTMNMSKVGLYRTKNPRNIPVYTRPRKTRRQTRRRK